MSARAVRSLFASVTATLIIGSCALTLDLDALSSGQCGELEKGCDGRCVSLFNPRKGCAQPSCAPCLLDNATANCDSAGQCAIAACQGHYDNCDGKVATGCEVDVDHDPLHCGACDAAVCRTPNGQPGCSASRCATGACDDGFGDCNESPADGCETDVLRSAAHCGECGNACPDRQRCRAGACADVP